MNGVQPSVFASAPAKINLSLDITGRREDGYHYVRTVMQSVTLRERAEVWLTDTPGITLTLKNAPPFVPSDRRNTAYKAAEIFMDSVAPAWRGGIGICVTKAVPVGAGLAGGSADAAAVLAAVNALFSAGLNTDELCALGARIGADVPFCIAGGTMLGVGTGTELLPVPPLPDCEILLVKPKCSVSTAEAYRCIDSVSFPPPSLDVEHALSRGSLAGVAAAIGNVFDAVCAPSAVEGIKAYMLCCGALGSQMTGSGSAVFGIFDDAERMRRCAEKQTKDGNLVFMCKPDRNGAVVTKINFVTENNAKLIKKPLTNRN